MIISSINLLLILLRLTQSGMIQSQLDCPTTLGSVAQWGCTSIYTFTMKRPLLADTSVMSIVSKTLYPRPELQPDQLRQGLGLQIASAASGIIGLIGAADAPVTTASFHLPICPFRPSHVVRTPGVLRNSAHVEGCGCVSFNSAACGCSPPWHRAKHLM